MEPIDFASRTDIGRIRKANQDAIAAQGAEELGHLADGLFVLADGMGGRAGGEIASRVAVETVTTVVREVLESEKGLSPDDRMTAAVREAILAANMAVFNQARANPELRGMGTTCVVSLILADRLAIGHVGDSRIYLLRGAEFKAVTHDHSLVAQHVLA